MATAQTQASGPKAKKVPATRPTVAGFLPFGEGDLFPQTLIDAINDSDTATAAVQTRAEFIIANGINDVALAEMVVNVDGQTLDDVIDGLGWNVAEGEVITAHVGYNGLGQTCSFRAVPWEQVRLVEPDERGKLTHAGIFPFLGMGKVGKKDRSKEHTLLNLYNPDPNVVLAQMAAVGGIQNYYGQLIYIKAGRPSSSYYAIPNLYGTAKNLETEAELTEFDFSSAYNGFNSPGFIKVLKRTTTKEDEDEDEHSLDNQIRENQGGANAGNPIVYEAQDKEELESAGFVPMTDSGLSNRYNSTNERVPQRIARRSRVPNELINIRKAGGIAPTGAEMEVASQMMQQAVNKQQRLVTRVVTSVFDRWHKPLPNADFSLENLNYFTKSTNDNRGTGQVAQPS